MLRTSISINGFTVPVQIDNRQRFESTSGQNDPKLITRLTDCLEEFENHLDPKRLIDDTVAYLLQWDYIGFYEVDAFKSQLTEVIKSVFLGQTPLYEGSASLLYFLTDANSD